MDIGNAGGGANQPDIRSLARESSAIESRLRPSALEVGHLEISVFSCVLNVRYSAP
jgi:hypothetical protein